MDKRNKRQTYYSSRPLAIDAKVICSFVRVYGRTFQYVSNGQNLGPFIYFFFAFLLPLPFSLSASPSGRLGPVWVHWPVIPEIRFLQTRIQKKKNKREGKSDASEEATKRPTCGIHHTWNHLVELKSHPPTPHPYADWRIMYAPSNLVNDPSCPSKTVRCPQLRISSNKHLLHRAITIQETRKTIAFFFSPSLRVGSRSKVCCSDRTPLKR